MVYAIPGDDLCTQVRLTNTLIEELKCNPDQKEELKEEAELIKAHILGCVNDSLDYFLVGKTKNTDDLKKNYKVAKGLLKQLKDNFEI